MEGLTFPHVCCVSCLQSVFAVGVYVIENCNQLHIRARAYTDIHTQAVICCGCVRDREMLSMTFAMLNARRVCAGGGGSGQLRARTIRACAVDETRLFFFRPTPPLPDHHRRTDPPGPETRGRE